MKIICTFLTLILVIQAQAQITEGQIIYQTRAENTANNENSTSPTVSESAFTVDFNKKYIQSGVNEEGVSVYTTIHNKVTGEKYTSLTNEPDKTIHFIDNTGFNHPAASDLDDTTVVLTDEIKSILGFSCKKSILQTRYEKLIIWTTDQIEGLELLYHFPKSITGTPMEIVSEGEGFVSSTRVTVFNPQTTLTNDLSLVPEGYTLDLGNIDFYAYPLGKYAFGPFSSIPAFIRADNYQEVIKSINRETYDLIYPKPLEKYTFPFILFKISIDEKGKIKSLEFGTQTSALVNVNELHTNIMKNCYFAQPIRIDGKAYPSVLTVSYNYEK